MVCRDGLKTIVPLDYKTQNKMANKKITKAEDYRSLDNDALNEKISDEEMRLKRTKFSHAVNPIENPLAIKQQRRQLARLKTEQRKRELGF